MAFNKKTWKARQGLGLNKFSIDGATPVPITNQPDSVTQQGDALSAGNLNDLEDRIANAFDDVENEKADKSTADDLQLQIEQHEARISNIEQVSGDYVTSDMQDYSTVPTGKASFALVETLKGVSRVDNQLAGDGNKRLAYTQATQNSDLSFSVTNTGWTSGVCSFGFTYPFLASHVYLCFFEMLEFNLAQSNSFRLFDSGTSYFAYQSDWGTNKTDARIVTPNANSSYVAMKWTPQSASESMKCRITITDLTLYFNGGTVPTLAEIQQYYPELLEPRAYNAGEIVDATYTSVSSSIWNNDLKVGGLDSGGAINSNEASRRTTDYIPVSALTSYKQDSPSSALEGRICYYNSSKVKVLFDSNGVPSNGVFTTPADCAYVRITLGAGYGTQFNHDICFYPTSWGNDHTLTIPSVTLKGAGSVFEVYDLETGEVTHPLGEVTITSSNLSDPTDNGNRAIFTVSIQGQVKYSSSEDVPNMLMAGFVAVSQDTTWIAGQVSMATTNLTSLYVIMPTGTTKADMLSLHGGDVITYELATPNPSTSVAPVLNNTLKTEGGGTVFTDAEVDGQFTLGFLNL